MPKNFKLAGKLKWKGVPIKEPRVLLRAVIGTLLAANLVAAVMAFKPFGGSADDLRREQRQRGRRGIHEYLGCGYAGNSKRRVVAIGGFATVAE